MDDLTIHIDELVLDGSEAPGEAVLTAALRDRSGSPLDPDVMVGVGRAVAQTLRSATHSSDPAPG